MGRIYDKDGNKMGTKDICREIQSIATKQEIERMSEEMQAFEHIKAPGGKLAHTFVEMYSNVGTEERGARLKKLMAGIINKYQKSITEPKPEEVAEYQALVDYINED